MLDLLLSWLSFIATTSVGNQPSPGQPQQTTTSNFPLAQQQPQQQQPQQPQPPQQKTGSTGRFEFWILYYLLIIHFQTFSFIEIEKEKLDFIGCHLCLGMEKFTEVYQLFLQMNFVNLQFRLHFMFDRFEIKVRLWWLHLTAARMKAPVSNSKHTSMAHSVDSAQSAKSCFNSKMATM